MPYNTLVTTCLLEHTSYIEEGVKVYVNRKRGEKILFFEIDDHSNPLSGIPKFCAVRKGSKRICDLFIYYNNNNIKYDILCVVELKNSINHEKDAIEQLIKTKNKLAPRVTSNCGKYGNPKPSKWVAYICYKRAKSSQIFDKHNRPKNRAKLNPNFYTWESNTQSNIGPFLRRTAEKLVN